MSKKPQKQTIDGTATQVEVLAKIATHIDSTTPESQLSQDQRTLLKLSRDSLTAAADAVGKLRTVAQFIREHHIALGQTQNQILIAAGFNKSRASEICKIALDTDKVTFDLYFEGSMSFRLALADARGKVAAEKEEASSDRGENEDETAQNHEGDDGADPQIKTDFAIAKAETELIKAIEVAVRKLQALNDLPHKRVKDKRLGGIYSKPEDQRKDTEKPTNDFRYSYNKFTVTIEAFASEANREQLHKINS